MKNAQIARMTSSQCISVFVGCPASPTQLPDGSCLIVDAADIDGKEWIEKGIFCTSFDELSGDDFVFKSQTVLAEFDGQIVDWYKFSDSRFNGPWGLSEFSEQFPNLRLADRREIEGITLSSLLLNLKSLIDPLSTYELIIRQGNPLIALQSAKQWLGRCARISLRCSIISPRRLRYTESFLKSSGFYQSSIDPSVWLPTLENSSIHLSLVRCGLLALFNEDAYQELHPELKERTDIELMNHWLSQPDFREVAEEMEKSIRNSLDQEGLLALFNADVYRDLHPELKERTDIELMNHWLSQPDFREVAEEMEKSIRNSLDQEGLLALFNADVYRDLHPELKERTDIELMNHWLSQPDFREVAAQIDRSVRRTPVPFCELTDEDPSLQILHSIFPFDCYRSQRPDISQLSNREIMNHFWQFGQHEGVDLSEKNIHHILLNERLKDYDSRNKILTARVHELEQLLLCSNAQIGAMQKLIAASQGVGVIHE